jgi:hypothetical protein
MPHGIHRPPAVSEMMASRTLMADSPSFIRYVLMHSPIWLTNTTTAMAHMTVIASNRASSSRSSGGPSYEAYFPGGGSQKLPSSVHPKPPFETVHRKSASPLPNRQPD